MTEMNLIEEVRQRATDAGLEFETKELPFRDDTVIIHYVYISAGKDIRKLVIRTQEDASELLATNFDEISYLADYDAVSNFKSGTIEAVVTSREQFGMSFLQRRLGFTSRQIIGDDAIEEIETEPHTLSCRSESGAKIEISESATPFNTLIKGRGAPGSRLSLKISGLTIVSHAEALRVLETLSNSLFFQIEMDRGVTLSLRKANLRRRPPREQNQVSRFSDEHSLEYPSFEYDHAPISLYWYARSARRMPLLQYLAFYQVVEYYFPTFAALESVRRARKILKSPTFRAERDSDLTKLVTSIASNGRVGGSERQQFKATILEVVGLDDVHGFFEENEDVGKIFGKKQKGITDKTVNLLRKDHDHRSDIAELLYDIRCRIVHTKNDAENSRLEMILPFSSEEENLWASIELMQFIARHALIRSSTTITTF